MLYTGKGDNGTTQFFGCNQRFSKSSVIAEALGSLDELNSFLGVCKTLAARDSLVIKADGENRGLAFQQVLAEAQQDLFVIQAETAGADKQITGERTVWLESVIATIEKTLPPIKNFVVPGGSEASGLIDFARTISRRTERRMVAVKEEGIAKISESILKYLNRLSSLLYALARLANVQAGVTEEKPHY